MAYFSLLPRPWLLGLGLLLAAPLAASAQVFYSNGATVFVNTGGVLYVNGAAQQTGAATLRTTGTATITGSLTSAAASTLDLSTGLLDVAGNVSSAGTTTATTGTLRLSGPANQTLDLNGGTVGQLVVNKATAGGTRVDVPSSFTARTGVTLTAGLVRTASTATLVLPAGATLTGEGPGQYVQGNVQVSRAVSGTTAVDFSNGVSINANNNGLGTVTATRTAGLQQAGASYAVRPGNSPTNSIDRIWAITVQTQPAAGTPATLQMSWPADDDGGLNTPALRTSAQAFRQPTDGGSYAAVGSAQDVSSRSLSVAVTAFSNWTVSAATSAPLPVELTEFTAQRQGEAARLTWATATEKHSAYFEVQVSTDGTSFRPLGQVAAAGSSLVRRSYSYSDAGLLSYGAPQVYYRLRQVDLDGTTAYSPVRVVMAQGTGLALYPNPAGHATTLSGAAAEALVQVYDALGRLVLTTQADAAGTAALALPQHLPSGLYLVRSGAGPALRLTVE